MELDRELVCSGGSFRNSLQEFTPGIHSRNFLQDFTKHSGRSNDIALVVRDRSVKRVALDHIRMRPI
jgi:hypothetical protein